LKTTSNKETGNKHPPYISGQKNGKRDGWLCNVFKMFTNSNNSRIIQIVVIYCRCKLTGKITGYTSGAVIEELTNAEAQKYSKMISLINEYNITVLSTSEEAERLADIYVSEGVIPLKYRTDGVHIAIAAVNDLDMVISMNFQHIVKRKTKLLTGNINVINGYRAVEIFNPMEVVENENDQQD